MIENIIITTGNDGEFDFQAEGYEPEIIEVYEDGIIYINPIDGEIVQYSCEFSAGCAIILDETIGLERRELTWERISPITFYYG